MRTGASIVFGVIVSAVIFGIHAGQATAARAASARFVSSRIFTDLDAYMAIIPSFKPKLHYQGYAFILDAGAEVTALTAECGAPRFCLLLRSAGGA